MPFFASTYDDDRLDRNRDVPLVGADPYMTQVQATPHGIMPSSQGGYDLSAPPSETASLISGIGSAGTGVINAYTTSQKMQQQQAYNDKVLALLGGGTPNAPAMAGLGDGGVYSAPKSASFADQDPEMARALQHQSHQRYLQTMQAPDTSMSATATPAGPITPTTPTGASSMKIGGAPMTPTPAAPSTPPVTGGASGGAGLAGIAGGLGGSLPPAQQGDAGFSGAVLGKLGGPSVQNAIQSDPRISGGLMSESDDAIMQVLLQQLSPGGGDGAGLSFLTARPVANHLGGLYAK